MGTIKTTNIEPIADNGTVTLGSSGDTFTVPSGVTITNNGTQTGFGGTNTPAFYAHLSSSQTGLSDSADTKVACNTETYDTDNCYDNSTNYRFTPTTAGKYFVYGQIMGDSDGTANLVDTDIMIKKNGSTLLKGVMNFSNNNIRVCTHYCGGILDMNGSSDYAELYLYLNTSDGGNYKIVGDSGQHRSFFGAYKIIT